MIFSASFIIDRTGPNIGQKNKQNIDISSEMHFPPSNNMDSNIGTKRRCKNYSTEDAQLSCIEVSVPEITGFNLVCPKVSGLAA